MQRLDDIAQAIKSANAGASYLTFDIVFADRTALDRVAQSGAVNAEAIGAMYKVAPADVGVYVCDPVLTIKVTIPRGTSSGGMNETDFDGTQQFAPLLDIPVP